MWGRASAPLVPRPRTIQPRMSMIYGARASEDASRPHDPSRPVIMLLHVFPTHRLETYSQSIY